jgi:hypothetical protein
MWVIYDAWFIDRDNNLTLPDGFNEELFDKTRDLNNLIDNFDYGIGIKPYKQVDIEKEMKKLRGGPLLSSLIGHINDKIYCTTKSKWGLFARFLRHSKRVF